MPEPGLSKEEQDKIIREEAGKKLERFLRENPEEMEKIDEAFENITIEGDKLVVSGSGEGGGKAAAALKQVVEQGGSIKDILPKNTEEDRVARWIGVVNFYREVRERVKEEEGNQKNEEPKQEASEKKEIWYERIRDDLREAVKVPRRWVNVNNRSLGERSVEQKKADQLKINEARERLKQAGVRNIDKLEKDREYRLKVAVARRRVFDDAEIEGMTREEAENVLREMGVDIEQAGEEKRPAAQQPTKKEEEKGGGSEEIRAMAGRDRLLRQIELVLFGDKKSRELGLAGERLAAVRALGEDKTLHILGLDIGDENTDYEAKTRRSNYMTAVKSAREGRISGFQADLFREIGVDVDNLGIEISQDEGGGREGLDQKEIDFVREYGCTREEYGKVLNACMFQIFVGGASSERAVLNSLVEYAGVWKEMKKTTFLPPELTVKLKEMKFDAWIGVARVMGEWAGLEGVDEITAGTLKEGLFVSSFALDSFGKMKDMLFLKKTDNSVTNYFETEEVPDIGSEISRAMNVLIDYFGKPSPENKLKLQNDYWKFMTAELRVRSDLYEKLGLNRYYGEAGFAFLLSNFMMAQQGVGLDAFRGLVKPPETEVRGYEIDETRSAAVRRVVQQMMIEGVDEKDQGSRLKRVREFMPYRLIPTGLDGGGEEALRSNRWIEWRNQTYQSQTERERRVNEIKEKFDLEKLEGEELVLAKEKMKAEIKEIPSAIDVKTMLTILRNAIDVRNAQKAVLAPDAGIDKLVAFKGKLFVHITNLTDAGYALDSVNFEKDPEVNNRTWVSRYVSGLAKIWLFGRSLADTETRNGKPWTMYEFINRARDIFVAQAQAQKEKFIGLDDPDKPESKERNKKHRRDMLEYVENLFKQCEDVVKPWGKLAVFLYSRAKNRGVPEWYGRVEDIQPAFRAQLTAIAESGYKGQWEAFQREIEKTI